MGVADPSLLFFRCKFYVVLQSFDRIDTGESFSLTLLS